MGKAERVTRAIKRYDPKLYCKESEDGKLCIFRKSQRIESYDVDGTVINFVLPAPYLIFALTNDWRTSGSPVDWGIQPIMDRVRSCDLWKRDIAEEVIKQELDASAGRERDLHNNNEAFLKDYRRKFARTFNDVRVCNMKKIEKRKTKEI